MNEQELNSLQIVIRFLWRDEQKHFEDMLAARDDASDHIYPHLETLGRYLTHAQATDVPPLI